MEKRVNITVIGKVQKVGFRFATVEKALELGLKGVVKNYEQDKVAIEVQGDVERLKDFLRWCHKGPEGAKITKVEYESSEELKDYTDFSAEWFI